MRIGESLHQRILDEVVGVGLFAVPAPHRAPQKRNFLLDLPQELRRCGRAGAALRLDRGAGSFSRTGRFGVTPAR